MNINYGDKSIITKYIQYYLRDNYLKPMRITGCYDAYTHEHLLRYLDSSNHCTQEEIIEAINNIVCPGYTQYIEDAESGIENIVVYLQYPIRYMKHHIDKRSISFYLEDTNPDYVLILRSLIFGGYREEFKRVCEDNGWYIIEYPDYSIDVSVIDITDIRNKLAINIVIGMKQYTDNFPHKDARYMVNYFNNRFIDNISIGNSIHEINSDYRVAMIPMEYGDTFIFAHRYRYSINVKIAFCDISIDDLEVYFNTTSNPTINRIHIYNKYITGEENRKIIPGRPLIINTKDSSRYSDCKTLLIQVPSVKMSDIGSDKSIVSIDRNIMVGDINNDGVIDEIDLLLYYMINNQSDYFSLQGSDMYGRSFCRGNSLSEDKMITDLIECINRRYIIYDNENASNRYGRGIILEDRYSRDRKDIDYIVEEIMYLSSGSDIACQRYIVNGIVKYRFMCDGNQSRTCMSLINRVDNNNNRVVDYESFYNYIKGINVQSDSASVISGYISKTDSGYTISPNRSDCEMFMEQGRENLSNTVLVIRTNTDDNINHVDEVIPNRISTLSRTTLNIPVDDYIDDPWVVHEKFLPMVTDMVISKYSEPDYIKYVHDLINSDILNERKGTIGNDFEYSNELRDYIREIQIDNNISFACGYLDPETNDFLYTSAYESYVNLRRSEVY